MPHQDEIGGPFAGLAPGRASQAPRSTPAQADNPFFVKGRFFPPGRNVLFGVPGPQELAFEIGARRGRAGNEFFQEVLKKSTGGMDPRQAILSTIQEPIGARFATLSGEDFFSTVQDLQEFLVNPEAVIKRNEVPASQFEKFSEEEAKQFFGARIAEPEPTAAEKLTDAILAARETGDTARESLLLQHLPTRADGRMSVSDYVTVLSAGVSVPKENVPKGLEGMTKDQAQLAQELGRAPPNESIDDIDLILRGLGVQSGGPADSLTPETASTAAILRSKLRAQAAGGPLEALSRIIQSRGGGPGAGRPGLAGGGLTDDEKLEQIFERHRDTLAAQEAAQEEAEATAEAGTAAERTPRPQRTPRQLPAPAQEGRRVPGSQTPGGPGVTPSAPQVRNFEQMSEQQLQALGQAAVQGDVVLSPDEVEALAAELRKRGQ